MCNYQGPATGLAVVDRSLGMACGLIGVAQGFLRRVPQGPFHAFRASDSRSCRVFLLVLRGFGLRW